MTTATTDKRNLEISIINKAYAMMGIEMIGNDESLEDAKSGLYDMLREYDPDKATKWQNFARHRLQEKLP